MNGRELIVLASGDYGATVDSAGPGGFMARSFETAAYRIHVVTMDGTTFRAATPRSGPRSRLVFDPVRRRFASLLPSIRVEMNKPVDLDALSSAVNAIDVTVIDSLEFAIVHLPVGHASRRGDQAAAVLAGPTGSSRPVAPPKDRMAIKRNGFAPRPYAPLLCLIVLGACGGGGSNDAEPAPPPPPATVSLAVTGNTDIEESGNPRVELMVELDAAASATVSVNLNFAGSATRDSDYAVEDDSVMIPAGASSGSVEIDVYRDFDDEDDETIEISLGAISGNAEAGTTNSIMLTVLDGAAATAVKMMDDDDGQGINLDLEVLAYTVTEDSVQFAIAAIVFAPADAAITETLVAEWSTDSRFEANVHEIGSVDVESADDLFDLFFGNLHIFRVPTSELAPDQVYYVRAYFDPPPPPGEFGYFPDDTFFEGFATDSEGRVRVRCEAPQRDASGGGDPLYSEQWHLVNTGQTAFSDAGGVAGADLQMSSAIAAGRSGDGVKLAVTDMGLETCHPDLSANAAGRGSYNFAYERLAAVGARPDQPYYFGVLGDHGTSVAGVAAAVANNGLGGRGVAPDVTLVGFNPRGSLD